MRISFTYLLLLFVSLWDLRAQSAPRTNPFEVPSRIQSSTSIASSQDSLGISQDSSTMDSLKMSGNPFEVNHVPLRKNNQNSLGTNTIQQISKVKPVVSSQFVFWIMIFSWLFLAVVISTKTNLLSYLVRSVFNNNMMKFTKRDETNNNQFLLVLLYIVFLINFSVFLYLVQKKYTSQDGIKIWVLCFLAISLIYLIRHVSMWLLGNVFPVEKESSLYNYIILVFNIIFGISIIPVNLILKYGPTNLTQPMIYLGLALFLLYFIVRNLRGLSISIFLMGQGIVSFFIYLCVFEVAPILLIVRTILNNTGIK
jgi:hypothetical protein